MARTSINKDGILVVHVDNPEEVRSILDQIFGEDFLSGKNPAESEGSFPIGKFPDIWPELPTTHLDAGDYPSAEDCSARSAKDCSIRKAPYGSTQPAPSPREVGERTYWRLLKDKALHDALKTDKLKVDLKLREAKLAERAMAGTGFSPEDYARAGREMAGAGFTSKDLAEAVRKITAPFPGADSPYLWPTEPNLKLGVPYKGKFVKPKMEVFDLDANKPVIKPKFVEEIEKLSKSLGAMQKKAREDAEEALAEKLYKRLSKHFYRDRAARYSRTAELLSQVNNLTEENRKLKADLRAKGEAMDYYRRAVANPESVGWNAGRNVDKSTAAFIYVTSEEFDTLKALADGSAVVIPASKKDAVAEPAINTELDRRISLLKKSRCDVCVHNVRLEEAPDICLGCDPERGADGFKVKEAAWFHFIDRMTGNLVVPMLGAKVAVWQTGVHGGTAQIMRRVEAADEKSIRVNHRSGGVSLWFVPEAEIFYPFGLDMAEWRYMPEPAPNTDGIPLNQFI